MPKQKLSAPALLGVKAAGTILDLSDHSVVRLARAGVLPHTRDSENRRVFQRDEIVRIAAQRARR